MPEKIRKSDCIFLTMLIITSILVFDIPFGLSPIMFHDSTAYMANYLAEGIVPLYPVFIWINRLIFPENCYMQMIIAEQIMIAAACTVCFVLFIKKNMKLNWAETYMIFVFSLAPYTVFMSEGRGMTSRLIATEALAYPLFYMLMMLILKGIWSGKYIYIAIADIMAVFMALTRSQLQLMLLIPASAFLLLWMKNPVRNGKKGGVGRLISGMLIACGIFILSYAACMQSNLFMQKGLLWLANAAEKENSSDSEINHGTAVTQSKENGDNYNAQYSSVIFVKVMILADKRDASLFEDANVRQAYIYMCDRMEQEQKNLASIEKNLLIGDKIQDNLYRIPSDLRRYFGDYIQEYPDSGIDISIVKAEIFPALLKAHPFKWMLSGILQFPSGLISTVFLHRRNMYWVSYMAFITIYAIAISMCIVRGKCAKQRDFMIVGIFVNFLFVFATSMVFVSIKRYVNYGFGMFYISLYCISKDFISELMKRCNS